MRITILVFGLGVGAIAGCLLADAFHCLDDEQCVFEGAEGTCEDTGYCSFADDDCESGKSYGEHAGAGLANECVPPDDAGGSDSTSGDQGGTDDVGTDDGSTGGGIPDDGGTGTGTSGTGTSGTSGAGTSGTGTSTDVPGSCGDGTRNPGEQCDGDDFGSETCSSAGAGQYGELACTANCELDTSGCTACTAPQIWDFSTCPAGWTLRKAYVTAAGSISWECGEPTSGPGTTDGHEGQWATNISGNYFNYESSALESPIIDLSQCNAPSVRLVFEHWWAFQGTSSNYDGGILQVSTDGGTTWTYVTPDVGGYFMGSTIITTYSPVVGRYGYSSAPGGGAQTWTTSELDLTSYLGEHDLVVRFVLGSNSAINTHGWYIDWVEVRAQ